MPVVGPLIPQSALHGGPTPTQRFTKEANEASVLLSPEFCALCGEKEPSRISWAVEEKKAAVVGEAEHMNSRV